MATNSLIFRFRVSAFLTVPIRYRIAYRFLPLSPLKKAAAAGFFFNALCRSGGTSALLAGAYARFQRPSAFAASICARPADRIRPCFTSSNALLRFTRDHLLLGLRGVKRLSQHVSSYFSSFPSIHP